MVFSEYSGFLRHDITKVLLKVVFNTTTITLIILYEVSYKKKSYDLNVACVFCVMMIDLFLSVGYYYLNLNHLFFLFKIVCQYLQHKVLLDIL